VSSKFPGGDRDGVIETKASMIQQFIDGLHRDLHVMFEEGTC
jgi:hypothetical protein